MRAGVEILWAYRRRHDQGVAIVSGDREEADIISLEGERRGEIKLARRLARDEQTAAIQYRCQVASVIGDEI